MAKQTLNYIYAILKIYKGIIFEYFKVKLFVNKN